MVLLIFTFLFIEETKSLGSMVVHYLRGTGSSGPVLDRGASREEIRSVGWCMAVQGIFPYRSLPILASLELTAIDYCGE